MKLHNAYERELFFFLPTVTVLPDHFGRIMSSWFHAPADLSWSAGLGAREGGDTYRSWSFGLDGIKKDQMQGWQQSIAAMAPDWHTGVGGQCGGFIGCTG